MSHTRLQLLQTLVEGSDFYTEGLQSRYPEQRFGAYVSKKSRAFQAFS